MRLEVSIANESRRGDQKNKPPSTISLVTLFYADCHGQHQPVNFRVYDKPRMTISRTCRLWVLEPAFVTGDSGYSCVNNRKMIKNHRIGLLFTLESKRLAFVEQLIF